MSLRVIQVGVALWVCACVSLVGGAQPSASHDPADVQHDVALADLAAHGSESAASPFQEFGRTRVLVLARNAEDIGAIVENAARANGTAEYVDAAIGYARIKLPVGRLAGIREDPRVAIWQLDRPSGLIAWYETESSLRYRTERNRARDERARTSPDSPAAIPISTTTVEDVRRRSLPEVSAQLGMDRLRTMHPTFDGRGATIAILEGRATRIPIDHPAFRHAMNLQGDVEPKIADFVALGPGARRVTTEATFRSRETLVVLGDTTLKLPRPGAFRFSHWHIGYERFAVLWDPQGGEIWVDTDHDYDFNDEAPIRDARRAVSVGTLPKRAGWTGRYFATFVSDSAVVFHPVDSTHAAMTASIAAGAQNPANLATGVAPNARLVLVEPEDAMEYEPTLHGYLEVLMAAAAHPSVDVISVSMQGVLERPESDTQFASTVIARIAQKHDKLIVHAVDTSSYAEARGPAGSSLLRIGPYLSADTARAFFGLTSFASNVVWPYGNRGPTTNGALCPDLVAPTTGISARMCDATFERNSPVPLPPCFQISGGTSAAAPSIAGLAAVLISAARQSGRTLHATDLRAALIESGRPVTDSRPIDQGYGVPQADVAWKFLNEESPDRVIASTPRPRHALQAYWDASGSTVGLYEREGWALGDGDTREITLQRTSGAAGAISANLSVLGDSETFRVPRSVTLLRDAPLRVRIGISAHSVGVHSAVLRAVHSATRRVLVDVPLTVVVADRFQARSGWEVHHSMTAGPFERHEYPIYVPPAVAAMEVTYRTSVRTSVRLLEPSGWAYRNLDPPSGGTTQRTSNGTQRLLVTRPASGTWFVVVADARDPVRADSTWSGDVRCRLLGIEPIGIRGSDLGSVTTFDTTVSNRFSRTSVALSVRPASRSLHQELIAQRPEPLVSTISVEADTRVLAIKLRALERDATLSAYLYDCTSGTCLRQKVAIPADVEQVLRIDDPSPGTWKLVVLPGPFRGRVTFDAEIVQASSETATTTGIELSQSGRRHDKIGVECGTGTNPCRRSHFLLDAVMPTESGRSRETTETRTPIRESLLVWPIIRAVEDPRPSPSSDCAEPTCGSVERRPKRAP